MKKIGYVCFPCWKETGRDRPYSRSYDLIAHMVNAHGKYPEGAVKKAAYSTDGSNVRDATEEEFIRYRDANKHRRKKLDEKCSSSEPGQSGTASSSVVQPKERGDQGDGDAFSGDRSGAKREKKKGRGSSSVGGEHGSASKRDDRESSQGRKDRESRGSERETAIEVEPDEEESDQRKMAEIQGQIEARKTARDLDLARSTIAALKAAKGDVPTATEKTATRKVTDLKKKSGNSRTNKKAMASKSIAGAVTLNRFRPPLSFVPILQPKPRRIQSRQLKRILIRGASVDALGPSVVSMMR